MSGDWQAAWDERRADLLREFEGRARQVRRTADRWSVAIATAGQRWYVKPGCGGCATDLLCRVMLRHPTCTVHVGPLLCPRHGGADAPFQCARCDLP